MYSINLEQIERTYKNNGQHAEQIARFTLTGEIISADNVPATKQGDCLDIQIKSARATICKGTDIKAYIEKDAAKKYGYVTADFMKMYVMTPAEYLDFARRFCTITRESEKNGGAEKLRFKAENKAMTEYLTARA